MRSQNDTNPSKSTGKFEIQAKIHAKSTQIKTNPTKILVNESQKRNQGKSSPSQAKSSRKPKSSQTQAKPKPSLAELARRRDGRCAGATASRPSLHGSGHRLSGRRPRREGGASSPGTRNYDFHLITMLFTRTLPGNWGRRSWEVLVIRS